VELCPDYGFFRQYVFKEPYTIHTVLKNCSFSYVGNRFRLFITHHETKKECFSNEKESCKRTVTTGIDFYW
jgi:hypothetical protein